jgi:hypothetical protein
MTPVLCPICTRSTLESIFEEVKIKGAHGRPAHRGRAIGLQGTEFGHLFFVRKVDVEAESKLSFGV